MTDNNVEAKETYSYIAQGSEAKRMFRIMQACVRSGVPFALVGNPGVGKTATIEAIAKAEGRELINLSLSTLMPEDVAGLPFPSKTSFGEGENAITVDTASYAMPVWEQRVLKNPHSILFLDEFSTAVPTTQHAFLQLVQNRRFPASDVPFSKDVAIVIAMNPATQAGGSALDLPIANRFAWFTFEQAFDDWAEGFKMRWESPVKMELPAKEVSKDEVMQRNLKIRSIIVKYINSDKGARQVTVVPTGNEQPASSVINKNDPAEMEIFRLAFPSARSWDNLAEVLSYIDPKDYSAIQTVINGIIGVNHGVSFYKYYIDNIKGVDIDEIMADPDSVDWKNMSIDESSGIFQALLEQADSGKLDKVLDVFIAIKNSGANNLLSGNRIQDIYKNKYLKKLPNDMRTQVTNKYLDAFGDFLKEIAKNS